MLDNKGISVVRFNGPLSRKVWRFDFIGTRARLTSYHEETRETKRHGWKGPKWDPRDERRYNSQIARPGVIPLDVLQEALDTYVLTIREEIKFHIGFFNAESRLENFP